MSWFTYALLAMLAKSGQNFAEKSSQQKIGSFLTMFLMIVISTLIILPYILLFDPYPAVNLQFWIGVIGSVTVYLVAKPMRLFALGTGDISEIVPLVSFSSLFSLVFGWIFLKEVPTNWGLLGVTLIAVGGYLINFERHQPGLFNKLTHPLKQVFNKRSQSFLFISLLLSPIATVFDKFAINNTFPRSPHYVLLTGNLIIIFPLAIILFHRKIKFNRLKTPVNRKTLLVTSLLFAVGTLLTYSALSIGHIGYVTAIRQLSSLIAVIGGVFILKEVALKKRLISAIIMAIGAFLVGYLG